MLCSYICMCTYRAIHRTKHTHAHIEREMFRCGSVDDRNDTNGGVGSVVKIRVVVGQYPNSSPHIPLTSNTTHTWWEFSFGPNIGALGFPADSGVVWCDWAILPGGCDGVSYLLFHFNTQKKDDRND